MKLNVRATSICAWRSASTGPRTPIRATSFCRLTKSFINGGTTRRTACGRTTDRIAWPDESPSERAAARCDSCTLSMPERKTSATYAEYDTTSATDPQMMNLPYQSGVCRIPGTPKPSRRIHRITGIPRTMSV